MRYTNPRLLYFTVLCRVPSEKHCTGSHSVSQAMSRDIQLSPRTGDDISVLLLCDCVKQCCGDCAGSDVPECVVGAEAERDSGEGRQSAQQDY